MITESHDEVFVETKSSTLPKLLGAGLALLVTAALLFGYTLLRKRHAETNAALVVAGQSPAAEPRKPPKALVLVDDAMLQGSSTILGGTVKNISSEKLDGVAVELELKRRKDALPEKRLVMLQSAQLDPQQEARYSLQLKAQDYSSARVIALRAGPDSQPLPYSTGQGLKRPLERLESKTITVEKRPSKRDEFLNSPDAPARVP